MKKHNYIYKTICQITGKYYIGMHSTNNLDDGYLGSGIQLSNSILKHGKVNHHREILLFTDTRELLVDKEREIVNEYLLQDPLCMNLMKGGSGPINCSLDSRLKMSKANLGKRRTAIQKETYSNSAIQRIIKQKQNGQWELIKTKISESKKGIPQNPDVVRQRTESIRELRKNGLVKPFSDQARANISNSLKGSSRNKKTWTVVELNTGLTFTVINVSKWCREHELIHFGLKRDKIRNINGEILYSCKVALNG